MPEFSVCYISNIDGAHVPFVPFRRSELAYAVECARREGHMDALRAQWIIKRGRKVILRVPRPQQHGQKGE